MFRKIKFFLGKTKSNVFFFYLSLKIRDISIVHFTTDVCKGKINVFQSTL